MIRTAERIRSKSIEDFVMEYASLRRSKSNLLYPALKRAVDIIMSLFAFVLISPLFLIIALCIKLEDGGRIFYTQERIGKNRKPIMLLKFRSMVQNAGDLHTLLSPAQIEEYYKEYKLSDDPRITRVGKLIRCGLDELPQILLILKGDLSFVGPRPLVKEELETNYGSAAEIFTGVTPGLTGYWQAYAHNEAKYENKRRQEMELYYVHHRSFYLDIKILFRTVKRVVMNK